MYIQSLRGILDLQETGVNETNFHEVNKFTFTFNLGLEDAFGKCFCPNINMN